jgi:hypothetical protein
VYVNTLKSTRIITQHFNFQVNLTHLLRALNMGLQKQDFFEKSDILSPSTAAEPYMCILKHELRKLPRGAEGYGPHAVPDLLTNA